MWNYELWRNAMYCVGVFVTCNAGGLALWAFAGRLTRKRVHVTTVKGLSEALSKALEEEAADEGRPSGWDGQEFADIRRQVDAADGDAKAERVTPEELAEAYRKTAPAPDAKPA